MKCFRISRLLFRSTLRGHGARRRRHGASRRGWWLGSGRNRGAARTRRARAGLVAGEWLEARCLLTVLPVGSGIIAQPGFEVEDLGWQPADMQMDDGSGMPHGIWTAVGHGRNEDGLNQARMFQVDVHGLDDVRTSHLILPGLGGDTAATGVNQLANKAIVGQGVTADGTRFGVVWQFSDLNTVINVGSGIDPSGGVEDSNLLGVNNGGRAVGSSDGGVPAQWTFPDGLSALPTDFAGLPEGIADAHDLAIGTASPQTNVLHAALFTQTEQTFFPVADEIVGGAAHDISPNGEFVAAHSVVFDFDTFQSRFLATAFVDADGEVKADQTASDYQFVQIVDANGDPLLGQTLAASYTGFLGGEMLNADGSNAGAFIWQHDNSELFPNGARELGEFLQTEFDLSIPAGATAVRALLEAPDTNELGLVVDREDGSSLVVIVHLPATTGDPPSPATLTLPVDGGTYDIVADGSDLVVRTDAGAELFRQAAASLTRLTLNGSPAADVLTVRDTGGPVAVPLVFSGDGGDDVFDASVATGDATLSGGAGRDTLTGGAGDDLIIAGGNHDVVHGGAGRDHINGGGGHDSLHGDSGNDWIHGGRGRDTITGGQDADRLRGGPGMDSITGGDSADRILGGPGRDTLDGSGGSDTLLGGPGGDELVGGPDDDTLNGVSRDDSFDQQVGRDRLIGGQRPAARPATAPVPAEQPALIKTHTPPTQPRAAVPIIETAENVDHAFMPSLLPDLTEL